MGELLLCRQEIAGEPFYLEEEDLNVYSLEEISYFIKENIDLLEPEFMKNGLSDWVRDQLKDETLSVQLRSAAETAQGFARYLRLLLESCSYCDPVEIDELVGVVAAAEHKSREQRLKLRADKLFQKKYYSQSIHLYQKILSHENGKIVRPDVSALILHNLGAAYANLFQFEAAKECFLKAFRQNARPEYLKAADKAELLLRDEEKEIDQKPEQQKIEELTAEKLIEEARKMF